MAASIGDLREGSWVDCDGDLVRIRESDHMTFLIADVFTPSGDIVVLGAYFDKDRVLPVVATPAWWGDQSVSSTS